MTDCRIGAAAPLPPGRRATAAPAWGWGWRRAALVAAVALAGCATPPPPPVLPAPVVPAPAPAPACPSCDDAVREATRLRQELATRDAEIRELRAQQREQGKALQASVREVTRAKARLRRNATQADAASYIAEVEVALAALRSSPAAAARARPAAVAEAILQSTGPLFAQGDYGTAMERAAQAEQLIAMAADTPARGAPRPRAAAEVPFDVVVALRVTGSSNLRRQAAANAPVQGTLQPGAAVLAHAYRGTWLRVEAADGRWGWLHESRIGAP